MQPASGSKKNTHIYTERPLKSPKNDDARHICIYIVFLYKQNIHKIHQRIPWSKCQYNIIHTHTHTPNTYTHTHKQLLSSARLFTLFLFCLPPTLRPHSLFTVSVCECVCVCLNTWSLSKFTTTTTKTTRHGHTLNGHELSVCVWVKICLLPPVGGFTKEQEV